MLYEVLLNTTMVFDRRRRKPVGNRSEMANQTVFDLWKFLRERERGKGVRGRDYLRCRTSSNILEILSAMTCYFLWSSEDLCYLRLTEKGDCHCIFEFVNLIAYHLLVCTFLSSSLMHCLHKAGFHSLEKISVPWNVKIWASPGYRFLDNHWPFIKAGSFVVFKTNSTEWLDSEFYFWCFPRDPCRQKSAYK